MTDGQREQMRVLEREFDSPVAAHRKAADAPSPARRQHRQRGLDVGQEILDQVILIARGAVHRVGVPTIVAFREDEAEPIGGSVARHARLRGPVHIVAGAAMQQKEQGIAAFGVRRRVPIGGQEVGVGLLAAQRLGIVTARLQGQRGRPGRRLFRFLISPSP